ncbi:MAG: hypothetical protein R6V51_04530 [Dehalococcoidia bacterium]
MAGDGVVDYPGLRAIVFDDRRVPGPFGVTLALAVALAVALIPAASVMVGGEDSGGQAGVAITMTGETGDFEGDPVPPSPPVCHDLVVTSTVGGNVTVPGEGLFGYEEGTVVDLAAEPAEGFRFLEWTGDVSTVVDATVTVTSIVMHGDYEIQAVFDSVIEQLPSPCLWRWILVGALASGLLVYFLWWTRRRRRADSGSQL